MKTVRNRHSKNCPYCNLDTKTRARAFLPQLESLSRASRNTQREKLKSADDCFIRFLADSSEAVLKRNIKFPNEVYPEISPYRDLLLFLAKKRPSLKKKRQSILKQKGGAFPLLGLLATALTSALGSFAGKTLGESVL
jgi:hypothetical protein